MPKLVKKTLRVLAVIAAALILCPFAVCLALYFSADLKEPGFSPSAGEAVVSDSLRLWKDNALRLNDAGVWEMKISGSPFERGEAIGKLAPDLLYHQEKSFADKLFEIVPSRFYRKFLLCFITIFNRRLGEGVPLEYRQELKAMSAYCTDEFNEFGNPYERQMQYHSAHDIGHVMQDYMLVGCSAFAVWGGESADSSLLIARNFDFYMGDEFAENKLVLFEKPDSGYAYVSVTWPGMTGVLSGMNTEGLTVSINASKLETPGMSATPVSMLAKRILQYASCIDEAWDIAGKYRTFVSESFLIGSARDGRAAVIEKTPSEMALYDPAASDSSLERIICTNHYQSELFRDNPVNQENIRKSDSMERFRRIEELLDSAGSVDVDSAVKILRDRNGVGGVPVGYCNELALNQLQAMHSVVFRPADRKIWVSTSPWQCGPFICYSLDKVLDSDFSSEIQNLDERVDADPFVQSEEFRNVLQYKLIQKTITDAISEKAKLPDHLLECFTELNPLYYNGYNICGNYYESIGDRDMACKLWEKSLSLRMKPEERQVIARKLERLEKQR